MNIFALHEDPYISAIHLHNRHVVKMILESAQMLSTALYFYNEKRENILKPAFINHPCTIWVRETKENYLWLYEHFKALLEEYNYRYEKHHVYENLLDVFREPPKAIKDNSLNKFSQAMPEIYKNENSILAYRRYYIFTKLKGNFYLKRRYELENWLLENIKDEQFKNTNIYKLNFLPLNELYDVNKHKEYIFVFGSNLSGRHGKGAAKFALENCNAIYGKGIGLQGNSYAIPTKDENIQTLYLDDIQKYVNEFLFFASKNLHLKFFVTRIGCGLAGYRDSSIAPMFANSTSNIFLPYEWKSYLI